MFYLLITAAGLVVSFLISLFVEERYYMAISGGVTGIVIGCALVLYGRFYVVSPLNPFTVTDKDLMFAGLTVGIIGLAVLTKLAPFCAAKWPVVRQQTIHVRREDLGYWVR